jgi:ABC-2 type transport system ATP-binding protein
MTNTVTTADLSAGAGDGGVVLRTVGLSKRYGSRLAVDGLNIAVLRGSVYGFLGPNGSGKTTTIAMALGLLAPTAGHVELFGLDTRTHRSEALRRVGATLEGTSYFPHLSARDNLRVWSRIAGAASERRIDAVLEQVGLAARKRDKVRNFSLGMKQRLAVGAAIMHEPEMVILDEPTNGLDPAGIREFRALIRDLAAQGTSVFVSSHILSEVEQMCDDVAILKSGRVVAEGSVAALLRRQIATTIALRTSDDARAMTLLQALPAVMSVTQQDGRLIVETPPEQAIAVSRALAEQQIWLAEMRPQESNLEDFFIEITGEEPTGA